MSYDHPTTCPEFFYAVRHRRPFDISVRNAGNSVRLEGHAIAVLSYRLDRFDFRGELAADVVRSAKDLYERYMGEQPAIAHFPMTRDTQPLRHHASDQTEQEPRPEGGKPDHRARYSDEAIYYLTATTATGLRRVLGFLTAGGEDHIRPRLSPFVPTSRADALRLGLQEAAKLVRERTAADPYHFDGQIVARKP